MRRFIHNNIDGYKTFVFCILCIVFIWVFPGILYRYPLQILASIWLIIIILQRHTEYKNRFLRKL